MVERVRIKISEQIDDEMKARIKRFLKIVIIQKYSTFKDFCVDFNEYLKNKNKRTNFTDKVLANKLNRGDIRFYEVLEILDFFNFSIELKT